MLNNIQKRFILFLFGCMIVTLSLVYVAKNNTEWLPTMGYLSIIPGSKAKDLSSAIATIKARLGFDQLQQMRNSSPTGGALGQVAVKELDALQASLASLDQSLDEKTLKANLGQIRDSYSRWQQAALGKLPPERRPEVGGTPSSNVVDFNKLK